MKQNRKVKLLINSSDGMPMKHFSNHFSFIKIKRKEKEKSKLSFTLTLF